MKNYDDEIYTQDSEEQVPKKKRFNIFDWYYNREKKDAEDDTFNPSKEPTFKNFFKLLSPLIFLSSAAGIILRHR